MSQPLRSAPPDPRVPANPRAAELERRIAVFDAYDEERFGRFTRADWWVLWVFAVLVPILALWRCGVSPVAP